MVAAARQGAEEAGSDVEIGLTTGAWIVPDLGTHLTMIRGCEDVDCATGNVSNDGFEHVMGTMLEAGVGVDVGIWAMEDVRRFARSDFWVRDRHITCRVIRRSTLPNSTRRSTDIGVTVPRLEHGDEEWTWPLVEDAFRQGWATRVGFEDSVFLPDGRRPAHPFAPQI
jgi:uncharacterized protein (DUF849 family)